MKNVCITEITKFSQLSVNFSKDNGSNKLLCEILDDINIWTLKSLYSDFYKLHLIKYALIG